MQLRHATPADIPRIRQLEQQAQTAAHWSAAQYDALFSPDAPARITIVAIDNSHDGVLNGVLKGFLVARCLADEWEIENVVVDVNFRRRGIGAFLVHRLAEEARAARARTIVLEVRESNHSAVQLYEKMGFRQDGRRVHYYQNPTEDALLYRLLVRSCDKIP